MEFNGFVFPITIETFLPHPMPSSNDAFHNPQSFRIAAPPPYVILNAAKRSRRISPPYTPTLELPLPFPNSS